MNKLLIIFLMGLLGACSRPQQEPSDDYVLIEFASKLEEEHDQLQKVQK